MRNPKRLKRAQKECLSAHNLMAKEWALVEETEFFLKIINKRTNERRIVDKFLRPKKGERRI